MAKADRRPRSSTTSENFMSPHGFTSSARGNVLGVAEEWSAWTTPDAGVEDSSANEPRQSLSGRMPAKSDARTLRQKGLKTTFRLQDSGAVLICRLACLKKMLEGDDGICSMMHLLVGKSKMIIGQRIIRMEFENSLVLPNGIGEHAELKIGIRQAILMEIDPGRGWQMMQGQFEVTNRPFRISGFQFNITAIEDLHPEIARGTALGVGWVGEEGRLQRPCALPLISVEGDHQ